MVPSSTVSTMSECRVARIGEHGVPCIEKIEYRLKKHSPLERGRGKEGLANRQIYRIHHEKKRATLHGCHHLQGSRVRRLYGLGYMG